MLAIFLVRPVAAIVVAVANEIQRYAHLAGARKLVHAAFLIGAAVMFIGSIPSSAIMIRITFPGFGDTTTRLATCKLITVARRVLAERFFFV